jgi:hypothetical protein
MEQPFLLVGITTTILEWVVLFCYNEPFARALHIVLGMIRCGYTYLTDPKRGGVFNERRMYGFN